MNPAKICFPAILLIWMSVTAQNDVCAFGYEDYSAVLKTCVDNDGYADYSVLKNNPVKLNKFLDDISALDKTEFDNWKEEDKIAFWINAYNAFVLKVVLDHYPIKRNFLQSMFYPENSIQQIPGAFNKIKFKVMSDKLTLDKIERDILRKQFHEPRISMALVRACKGCPPLRTEPYSGDNLDYQLNDQARKFLLKGNNFSIDKLKSKVYISSLYKWFGDDFVYEYMPEEKFQNFGKTEQAILNFIASYLDKPQRQYLLDYDFSIIYLDFDWSLNERKNTGTQKEHENDSN